MRDAGFDPEASLSMEQLVPGREVSIAVTGISGGGILRGVQYHNWWAETHSLVMRAQSGTVREIIAKHRRASAGRSRQGALTADSSRAEALLEPPSRALRAGMWTASLGLRALGPGRYALGDLIGTCIYAASPTTRRRCAANHRRLDPTLDAPAARRRALASFRNYARTSVDFVWQYGVPGARDAPPFPSLRARERVPGDRGARRRGVRARALRQLGRRRRVRARLRSARDHGDGAGRPRPGDQDRGVGEAASGPRGAGVVECGARPDPRGAPGQVRRHPQRHSRSRRDGDRRFLRRQGRLQHRGVVGRPGGRGAGAARRVLADRRASTGSSCTTGR